MSGPWSVTATVYWAARLPTVQPLGSISHVPAPPPRNRGV